MKPARARLFHALPLLLVLAACAAPAHRRISVEEYRDKVHGGWLGQNVANLFGLPFEFKYNPNPGPIPQYDPDFAKKFPPHLRDGSHDDDDTIVELVNLTLVDEHGFDITWEQIAAGWVKYLKGGLYVANEQAWKLMKQGVVPPDTGNPRLNKASPWNLSGQFTQESWGLIAPGMPAEAQRLADRFARVPVYGEAVMAAHFVSTLYAEAFFEKDVRRLMRKGIDALPRDSVYRRSLEDVMEWSKLHPDDWRPVRKRVDAKYFGKEAPKWNINSCVINGAMCAIAILYGGGDFEKTMFIAVAAGYDADCNAATVGGLCGVINGSKGIPDRWSRPLNDLYRIRFLEGFPKEMKMSEQSQWIAQIGERLVLSRGGRREKAGGEPFYVIPVKPPRPIPLDPPDPPEPRTRPE